jgi:hypothetical protein
MPLLFNSVLEYAIRKAKENRAELELNWSVSFSSMLKMLLNNINTTKRNQKL